MGDIKNIIKIIISEDTMGWLETSIVLNAKELGFTTMEKTKESGNEHFSFTKEIDGIEGIISMVITEISSGLWTTLRVYDKFNGENNLFSGVVKTPSELLKLKEKINEYENGLKYTNLGISTKKQKELSKYEIQNMIDKALDNRNYKEVERLSKMLGEGFYKKSVSTILEIAGQNREMVFKNKKNRSLEIRVNISFGRIESIENKSGMHFPFVKGQPINRNIEIWACNNNWFMDDKDTCPEKKIFGVPISKVPQGHEWRMLYPNKFR